MEDMQFLTSVGVGIILPIVQDFLNKYIPQKYRLLVVFLASLLVGAGFAWFKTGSFEGMFGNTTLIFLTAQTVYFKVLKELNTK